MARSNVFFLKYFQEPDMELIISLVSRSALMQQHKKSMDEIMDIIFAMEQEFEEAETEAKQEFHSLRDEIKNKVNIS